MATKAIPVTAAKVSGSHSNMPVYINPSVMTGWGTLTQAETDSLRFYSDEALTTELARECVSPTEIHVKVPSLTTSTTIYADYDGVRSDYATSATYGRDAVWSDYEAVYHNQEDPSGTAPQMIDSTGNGNNGTSEGSMTTADSVASQIDKGLDFDGSNDLIRVTSSTSLNTPSTTKKVSISAWAKANATGGTPQEYVAVKGGTNQYAIIFGFVSNKYEFFSSGSNTRFDIGTIADTNSKHVVAVFDDSANHGRGYLNGVETTTSLSGTLPAANSQPFTYGAAINSSNVKGNFFTGVVDEVRVRSDALTADWITTEYNNQSDVASFWGTVTDAGGGGGATLGLKLGSTTINKVMLGNTEIKKVYLGSTTIYENL